MASAAQHLPSMHHIMGLGLGIHWQSAAAAALRPLSSFTEPPTPLSSFTEPLHLPPLEEFSYFDPLDWPHTLPWSSFSFPADSRLERSSLWDVVKVVGPLQLQQPGKLRWKKVKRYEQDQAHDSPSELILRLLQCLGFLLFGALLSGPKLTLGYVLVGLWCFLPKQEKGCGRLLLSTCCLVVGFWMPFGPELALLFIYCVFAARALRLSGEVWALQLLGSVVVRPLQTVLHMLLLQLLLRHHQSILL
jgi:hypothetical protein